MTATSDLTVAIVAFNAADTIGAAIDSVTVAGAWPILLVDDQSTDDTVARARHAAGAQLSVVTTEGPRCVGNARATALKALETPYALWLDADDLLVSDRPHRVRAALVAGADLVFDGVYLIDADGKFLNTLAIPDFMQAPGRLWRQVERNWLHGLCGGFRAAFVRQIGYATDMTTGEDYLFSLQALTAGARVTLLDSFGIYYRHSSGSLSRNRANALANIRLAHDRLDWSAALDRMQADGLPAHEIDYIRAVRGVYQGDTVAVLQAARSLMGGAAMVPPYGRSAAWMGRFLAGTALLADGKPDQACAWLELAYDEAASPDVANNLAVARARTGAQTAAGDLLDEALAELPGYVDAAANRDWLGQTGEAGRTGAPSITLLPLRTVPYRDRYGR